MKPKIYLAAVVLSAIAMFSACKKGDTGPAGANGTNGANGNANVQSESFPISVWDSSGSHGTAGYYFYTNIADSIITSNVVGTGAVLVYYNNNQLPMTQNYPGYTRSFNDSLYSGGVQVRVSDSDGNSENPGSVTVRVVVIPSEARMAGHINSHTTYEQLKTMYNLKD